MIRGLLIGAAIVSAWISGAATPTDDSNTHRVNGAAWFLVVAILCGVAAWGW